MAFARSVVLSVVFLPITVACGGKVTATPPKDGEDASVVRDTAPTVVDTSTSPDTTSPTVDSGATAEVGPMCCPMGTPGCDGPLIGGSPPCGKRGIGNVRDWDVKVDEHGCPYLTPRPGGEICGDPGGTTGLPCTDDTTCDLTGDGVGHCSNAIFVLGTLYPSPVCIGVECTGGTHDAPADCDRGTGLCLSAGGAGICLPPCAFDGSGAKPTGCVGIDACNPYGWTTDASGVVHGVGYCFGGCRSTADCTKGDVCQAQSGLCVKKLGSYSKPPGTACDSSDGAAADVKCNCLYDQALGKGYCVTTCRFGIDTCPAGFTCDAQLPKDKFTTTPIGLAGNCLRDCTSDVECAPLSARCLESAGTGRKTCQTGLPN